MILLSRLIKSIFTNEQEKKEIKIKTLHVFNHDGENEEINEGISYRATEFIESAKMEAEQILQSAREKQDELMKQLEHERSLWIEERALLVEEAKREGYVEGREIGRNEALAEYEDIISHSRSIVDRSQKDYIEKIESAEETILQLSLKVAEKVMATKLTENPHDFLHIVKQVLKEVKEYENIKIHVHPTKYELVLNQKNELMSILTNETDLFIYANEEAEENSCYIESPYGRIDASIDTQLVELKQQLIELLGEE